MNLLTYFTEILICKNGRDFGRKQPLKEFINNF